MAGLGGLGIIGSLLQGWQQGQQNAQQQQMQRLQQQMQLQAIQRKMQEDQQAQRAQADLQKLALSGALDQTGNPLGLGMGTPTGTDQVSPQTPGPGIASPPRQTATDLPQFTTPNFTPAPAAGDLTGDTSQQPSNQPPAASPTDVTAGLDPTLVPIEKRESAGKPNVGFGGIDLSNAPRDQTGFPQWSGKEGPAGISHAAGLFQFQPGTWGPIAKDLGIHDFSVPSQIAVANEAKRRYGTTPWAASEPGGTQTGAGAPPGQSAPLIQEAAAGFKLAQPIAQKTAVAAATQFPTQVYGGASIQQMAQAIDKIDPSAPPAVKFLALTQMQKMMAPAEKQQMQMMMLQNRQEFAIGMAQLRSELAAGTGGTPLIVGGVTYNVKGNQATPIQGLPTGQPINRIGANTTPGGAKLDQDTLDSMADQYLAGDKSALTGLGYGNIGAENRAALRKTIQQRAKAAGMDGKDIAARIAEFTGITAGERTLGTRAATLGLALNEAKAFVPLALDLSDKIDRTQFPNFNSIELAVEKGTGDENVARFNVANRSIISLYSQVLRRGGVPSDQSDREAQELLQTAYSQGQYKAAVDQIMKEANAAQASPAAVRSELRGAITGRPSETTPPPTQQTQLPTDLPDPKGLPDGKVAVDENGKVVARISGGKWTPP